MGWLVRFSADEAAAELLMSELWDRGTTGIFQAETGEIVAGFTSEADARVVAEWLTTGPAVVGPESNQRSVDQHGVSVEPAPTAAELAPDDPPATVTFEAQGRSIDVVIRAGGAFGHGGHQTTRLAAQLLLEWLQPNQRVLDVGAGTGVLGILASKAGAGQVFGLDNDPLAVDIANENATANSEDVPFGLWTVTQTAEMFDGPIDLVVMNVLLPVHGQLAPEIVSSHLGLAAGEGLLITTGYLSDQSAEVLSHYSDQLTVVTERTMDGWSANVLAASASALGG